MVMVEELSREVQVLLPHTACWHDQLPNRGSEGCCQHSPYYFSIWRPDTLRQRVTWIPRRTHCPIFSKNHHTTTQRWAKFYGKPAIAFICSQEKNMEDNAQRMDWLRLVVWRIQCACTCPLWFGHTFLSFFLPAEYFFVPLSWYEIHDMHCFFSAASFICRQRTNAVD